MLILDKDGRPRGSSSWYKEDQLFLLDKDWDIQGGIDLIHEYRVRG